jgi:hypothetical protein
MPVAAAPAITPVVAQPVILPAPEPEIAASSSAVADRGSPMIAGRDAMVTDTGTSSPAPASPAAAPSAPAGGWLSPEGALTGEFGELVEDIPAKPTAEAPVFPTPPAPWPAVPTPIAPSAAVPDDGFFDGGDIDAELGLPPAVATSPASDTSASRADTGFDTWTPETSEVAIPHEASEVPGLLDTSAREGEVWADAYGAEADAIHGLEATSQGGGDAFPAIEGGDTGTASHVADGGRASNWWEAETNAQPAEPAGSDAGAYLAAEWPEPTQAPDPSTLPTPVLGVAALDSNWTGRVPDLGALPAAPDADAAPAGAYTWPVAEAGNAPGGFGDAGIEHGGAQDSWEFAPAAESGGSLHAQPTSSSLAAAEALELVAAQLRNGALRADGYSPALGEAAALSAVLAALLGVDARWDMPR